MDPAHDAFFALTSDLLGVVGGDGILQRANLAWTAVLGWELDTLVGTRVTRLVHPDDAAHLDAVMASAAPEETVRDLELRMRCRVGGTRRIVWTVRRGADDDRVYVVGRDVTALRRATQRLHHLEAISGIGTVEFDLDRRVLHWSPVARCLHGMDASEVEPTLDDVLARYPDDALTVLRPAIDALTGRGLPFDLTVPFTLPSGDPRWLRFRARAELRDRLVVAAHGTIEDVTDAREERLRLLRFRELVELGRDGIWELSPTGTITYANARLAELLETTVPDLLGRPVESLVDPGQAGELRALVDAEPDGRVQRQEYALRTSTGERRWVMVASRGRFSAEGVLLASTAMISDVTALKEQEEQLRLSADRLRTFVELAPLGIVRHDFVTGVVLDANRAACRMAGLPADELRGHAYADLLEIDPQVDRSASQENAETGRFGPIEAGFVRNDGTRLTVEVTGVALLGEASRVEVWSLIRDITERRRLERLKDEFVATVSHELRTPLTSISGALELLHGRMGLDHDRAPDLLRVAVRNSERLTRLIDDILDLSRLDSVPMPIDAERCDLAVLVRGAVEAAEGAAAASGVALHLDVGAGGCDVLVDGARMEQVIGNLLVNAIRFSPAGGVVEVSVGREDEVVVLAVRDHGPGVPDWFVPRLFERFAQADSSDRRRVGGTGLGLSIVRALAERHNGAVAYDPPPDGGARFVIRLPALPTRG